MSNYAISGIRQHPSRRSGLGDASVGAFKNRCDWFVVTPTVDGQGRICTKKDVEELLREDILAGRLRANGAVRVYSKRGESWDESTPSLRDFAQQHSKLQAVYEPVWAFVGNAGRDRPRDPERHRALCDDRPASRYRFVGGRSGALYSRRCPENRAVPHWTFIGHGRHELCICDAGGRDPFRRSRRRIRNGDRRGHRLGLGSKAAPRPRRTKGHSRSHPVRPASFSRLASALERLHIRRLPMGRACVQYPTHRLEHSHSTLAGSCLRRPFQSYGPH
jgi:hypothetical protein